jgi:2'-5' RNA ligase
MRVFFAIEFDEDMKTYFSEIQEKVRDYCLAGNFTLKENFHLTLRYIGEQNEVQVRTLMNVLKDAACVSSIELLLNKLGSFSKGNKSILWMGLQKNSQLQQLYNRLEDALQDCGYDREGRSYSPHITLAREVRFEDFKSLFDRVQESRLTIKVKSISLMESKRVNNKLCYIPLKREKLQE